MTKQRSQRIRDPNARLQRTEMGGSHHMRMPLDKQIKEIRDILVDLWSLISPFSQSQTDNYTVTGKVAHEKIIMANTTPKTVTLQAFPKDLAEVTVKRTDAEVTIDGNGNTIDGQTTKTLGTLYDGPNMIYTDAAGEWSLV